MFRMRVAALAGAASLVSLLAPVTAAAQIDPGSGYVALGDSYTSGPLVTPFAVGPSPRCLQSAANYPHLIAQQLGLHLTDVSCSGADVTDLSAPQFDGQPAQFDALTPTTKLVTLGIGGNDNKLFSDSIVGCATLDIAAIDDVGAPCEEKYGSTFLDAIAADASDIAATLNRVRTSSPGAAVYVVGYPSIVPQSGRCYPQLPLTSRDVQYVNRIGVALNTMLEQQAMTHGAMYVDTYTASIGHDACQPVGQRWVEPLVPTLGAFPLHPNATGLAHAATAVEAAISAA